MRRLAPAPLATFLLLALALGSGPARAGPSEAEACQELLRQAAILIARAERSGDPASAREAADLLGRAANLCPEDPEIPFRLAVACVLANDREGALAAERRLEGALVARARALNKPEALALGDPRVHYVLALVPYRWGGAPKQALDELAKVRAVDPGFLPASVATVAYWSHLAYAAQLVEARAFETALEQTRLALVEAKGDAPREDRALRRLAEVLRLAGRPADARAAWENLLSRHPTDAVIRYGLATCLDEEGEREKACEAWKEAVRVAAVPGAVDRRDAPLVADVAMRYGVSLARAGRFEEGQALLQEYASAHREDARPWFHLGVLLLERRGDPVQAATCLEQARRLDPFCERTLQALHDLYTGALPNPERARALRATLDSPDDRAARQRETARRVRSNPDRTDGCQ